MPSRSEGSSSNDDHRTLPLGSAAVDRADYVLRSHLIALDWLAGLAPEPPADQAIREKGGRQRKALPWPDERRPRRRRLCIAVLLLSGVLAHKGL